MEKSRKDHGCLGRLHGSLVWLFHFHSSTKSDLRVEQTGDAASSQPAPREQGSPSFGPSGEGGRQLLPPRVGMQKAPSETVVQPCPALMGLIQKVEGEGTTALPQQGVISRLV